MSQEFSNGIDFSQVEEATSTAYLKPGVYDLTATKAEFIAPEGKTPSVKLTLQGKEGVMTHSFYVTAKALGRLKYLHRMMFDATLDRPFESLTAFGTYMAKAFEKKQPTKRFLVSGKQGNDGKIYADLDFTNFIVDPSTPEGAFREGSSQWTSNVKMDRNRDMVASDDAILPSSSGTSTDDSDNLPF